jgi:hypothetical protein
VLASLFAACGVFGAFYCDPSGVRLPETVWLFTFAAGPVAFLLGLVTLIREWGRIVGMILGVASMTISAVVSWILVCRVLEAL